MTDQNLKRLVPELDQIARLHQRHAGKLRLKTIASLRVERKKIQEELPVQLLEIGSNSPSAPTYFLVGGVHGVERIGTQVVLSYLESFLNLLDWDRSLQAAMQECRIVAVPVLNPWGMAFRQRSNARGVDLMRNAPIEAEGTTTFLVSGHRLGPFLPWYRGKKSSGLEPEVKALIDYFQEYVFPSPYCIVVDVHSGFGMQDQIWVPYAKSRDPFRFQREFNRLRQVYEETFPYHIYKIEPQSHNYMTHGDLWDYVLWIQKQGQYCGHIMLPLTLELGSWMWIKKNPMQFFSFFGLFNPVKQHRHKRILRRHYALLDFLFRAVKNHHHWQTLLTPPIPSNEKKKD